MARRGSRVQTDDEDVELNMTPMLDVVFILLIFFIVTAVFVKEPGVDVIRPDVNQSDSMKPTLLVAVTSADEIWINRNVYEISQVRGVLEQLLSENPRAEAMIQGDQDAPIGTVLDIQEMLTQLGVEEINISEES
ncbi:MAG: biopolymer transporter ExbD [Rhodobacterales bacterium CG15_BIG_FIL_POST_REV_8_21_14_020_59_13]|nr:MAG: biopolymer transporter ExbD [Rhodobacterales bacterium CG15_BIG_FIL_POST_REV_8_21_14_020_59_13]PIW47656.1 MAG: biopolymer transporter ExbD [bacterium (Candidatus Blackallbacteria) CG13_big_fil_rev_8_21_14_2_50_49_14]